MLPTMASSSSSPFLTPGCRFSTSAIPITRDELPISFRRRTATPRQLAGRSKAIRITAGMRLFPIWASWMIAVTSTIWTAPVRA